MQYRHLGRSGLRLSELSLGSWVTYHNQVDGAAAREMLANLPALARAWEAAGVTLEIGIGLNSGPVAMDLSGKHHLEPTVIGDAVNVSARLEGLTKEVG